MSWKFYQIFSSFLEIAFFELCSIAINSHGPQELFLSGSQDKTLRLWDVRSNHCQGFLKTQGMNHIIHRVCLFFVPFFGTLFLWLFLYKISPKNFFLCAFFCTKLKFPQKIFFYVYFFLYGNQNFHLKYPFK